LLVPFSSVPEVSPFEEGGRYFLCWKTRCPCCFEMKVPEPEWEIKEDFADVRPKVGRERVVLSDFPVLDDSTGEECTKTILVRICTVAPVVSSETASQFKFCSPDGVLHRSSLQPHRLFAIQKEYVSIGSWCCQACAITDAYGSTHTAGFPTHFLSSPQDPAASDSSSTPLLPVE
jgi:hypothetical protein